MHPYWGFTYSLPWINPQACENPDAAANKSLPHSPKTVQSQPIHSSRRIQRVEREIEQLATLEANELQKDALHGVPYRGLVCVSLSLHVHSTFLQKGRSLVLSPGSLASLFSLGGVSPEKKAGQALKKLFTFCAATAVMAQLEGSGRGALGSYNASGYSALRESISALSKTECNTWLTQLAQRDKMIALRVMEVRAFYCEQEFEWDSCKRVTLAELESDNLTLMRDLMETTASFKDPQ